MGSSSGAPGPPPDRLVALGHRIGDRGEPHHQPAPPLTGAGGPGRGGGQPPGGRTVGSSLQVLHLPGARRHHHPGRLPGHLRRRHRRRHPARPLLLAPRAAPFLDGRRPAGRSGHPGGHPVGPLRRAPPRHHAVLPRGGERPGQPETGPPRPARGPVRTGRGRRRGPHRGPPAGRECPAGPQGPEAPGWRHQRPPRLADHRHPRVGGRVGAVAPPAAAMDSAAMAGPGTPIAGPAGPRASSCWAGCVPCAPAPTASWTTRRPARSAFRPSPSAPYCASWA